MARLGYEIWRRSDNRYAVMATHARLDVALWDSLFVSPLPTETSQNEP